MNIAVWAPVFFLSYISLSDPEINWRTEICDQGYDLEDCDLGFYSQLSKLTSPYIEYVLSNASVLAYLFTAYLVVTEALDSDKGM